MNERKALRKRETLEEKRLTKACDGQRDEQEGSQPEMRSSIPLASPCLSTWAPVHMRG